MARILFAAHPTVGHTSALRAMGARLREQGHALGFAMVRGRLPLASRWPAPIRAGVELCSAIEADGFELLALRPVLEMLWRAARLPSKTGSEEMAAAFGLFTAGLEDQSRAIAAHAERWRADVVVGDYLLLAALFGAALARRPYIAVYHSALPFPAEGAAPFGSRLPDSARGTPAWAAAERANERGLARSEERVLRAAKALGLPAPRRGFLTAPISRDLNLLATVPDLEPGLAPLEGPVAMIGPCLRSAAHPKDANHPALSALPRGGLRVYLSLGTVFNGKPDVFARALDGLEACGAHVVVSAGASYRDLAPRAGPRTHVFPFVPQVALLPQVDVVVTHGGNNTVQECLASGRPMVVLPFGADQRENASRVERLGVGAGLDAASFTPQSLQHAVLRARGTASAAARRIAGALAGVDGAARGAREILRVAAAARAA